MKKLLLISLFLFLIPQLGLAKHDYPRLANLHYYWSVEDNEVEDLAQWDMLIVDIENAFYTPGNLKKIKQENPDILIIAYISSLDIRRDAATSLDEGTLRKQIGEHIEESDWILRNAKGNEVHWWEDYYILNITSDCPKYDGQRWNEYLPRVVSNRLKENPKVWDGVMYDNMWEGISWVSKVDLDGDGNNESSDEADAAWKKGMRDIIKKTRNYMGDDFIVLGNGGTSYSNKTDGNFLEHFPTTSYGKWTDSMLNYYYIADNAPYPVVNTNNDNKKRSKVSYRKFRYGLTSTLLSKGYYSYDKGDYSHTEKWWFDEYSVALGSPLSDPYNLINPGSDNNAKGVWRRDFENGLVLVNSTSSSRKVSLESGYEKINGDQDPDTNNGKLIGSLTVPAHDGIILLGKLAQIINVPYVNGGYSKVFNSDGDLERNSFYSYNSNYPGGTQIVEIPEKDKTVVADETYIYVYKNNKLKYKFAPYGEDFTGGVNIAVDKIYKKDSKYYIVTGTQQYGPQIRIFNMKGKLKDPGCFPYAESFQGGVNVGVGDLNGDGRMEIISAAGYGGGPHIRILNNKCEVINPGFFAYDSAARFGVNIGVGDLDGDGKAEIVTGPGPGGSPHIRIFNKNGKIINNGFYAYDKNDTSGVLVGVTDIDQNGSNEIVTSSFGIYNY